ncbi:MAG TPA: MYXO-CTERM sorting domain-containing protein, partial [Polyangiales bacterium]
CTTGLSCVAGACLPPAGPGGASGMPDAGAQQPNGGAGMSARADGGAQLPPTSTDMNPIVTPGSGGMSTDDDDGGCSLAPGNHPRAQTWPLWASALVLAGRLRRRRRR